MAVVAHPLGELAVGLTAAAGAAPSRVDGQQLTVMESLAPDLASLLMAHRYQEWSRRQINWSALAGQGRDPTLVSIVVPVYGDPAELDGCLQALKLAESSRRWELIAVMNDPSPQSTAVLAAHQQNDCRIQAV